MSDWPVLPRRSEIRAAAEDTLAPLGFRRRGSWTFQKDITKDLIAQVHLNGNEAGQSVFIGAIWMPANRAALEVWDEVGREWLFGKRELYPGVPLRGNTFRHGVVGDAETGRRQRMWVFCEIPLAEKPVSLREFCSDLKIVADDLVAKTPNVVSALQNPQLEYSALVELEPTVHATLGDRTGFDQSVQRVFDYFALRARVSEDREREPEQQPDATIVRIGGPALNYKAYFDAVRRRFF